MAGGIRCILHTGLGLSLGQQLYEILSKDSMIVRDKTTEGGYKGDQFLSEISESRRWWWYVAIGAQSDAHKAIQTISYVVDKDHKLVYAYLVSLLSFLPLHHLHISVRTGDDLFANCSN